MEIKPKTKGYVTLPKRKIYKTLLIPEPKPEDKKNINWLPQKICYTKIKKLADMENKGYWSDP